jgi:hypothetical protein
MMFDMPVLRDGITGNAITALQLTARNPDDRTEIAHVPASRLPHSNVGMDIPMHFEVSLSDREQPMTIFDFDAILQEVRGIVEHFRPTIVQP